MTGDTEGLIRRLAEQIEPVRPLSRPWMRAARWLVLSASYIGVMLLLRSPRSDLSSELSQPHFLIEQVAALATGIAAAAAAFASVVPGHNRRFLALPLLPLAVWLGSLGQGCVQDWIQLGPQGLSLRPDWFCLRAIAVLGAVPAIAMVLMLRRGAPLTPHLTTALGVRLVSSGSRRGSLPPKLAFDRQSRSSRRRSLITTISHRDRSGRSAEL